MAFIVAGHQDHARPYHPHMVVMPVMDDDHVRIRARGRCDGGSRYQEEDCFFHRCCSAVRSWTAEQAPYSTGLSTPRHNHDVMTMVVEVVMMMMDDINIRVCGRHRQAQRGDCQDG